MEIIFRKSTGFTIIELLMVISIIGLLASVVLAFVKSARQRSANTKITENIRQYRNALELYRSDYGSYPLLPDPTNWKCLGGGYPGGICGWVSSPGPMLESPELKAALSPYIPQIPLSTDELHFPYDGGGWIDPTDDVFSGVVYLCKDFVDGKCTDYAFMWALHGVTNKCGNGGMSVPGELNTLCFMGRQLPNPEH